MHMSDYDRWITRTPADRDDEEPELTGLAGEAQALVDALDDTLDAVYAYFSADGRLPIAHMVSAQRIIRIRDRAAARVQRRIMADARDAYEAGLSQEPTDDYLPF